MGEDSSMELEASVGALLMKRGWTLTVAESCTGGMLSQMITSVPGASAYFERGFITYSNRAKRELLGVPQTMLIAHGAVSAPVARAMAEGARAAACATVSLAVTGIAGPTGGSPQKPVGTVFVACSGPTGTVVRRYVFRGDRHAVQQQSAQAALTLLWKELTR